MSAEPAHIAPFQYLPAQLALDPVYNILNSFALLNVAEQRAGLGEWVTQTVANLTPERRHINQLVFAGLPDALSPDQEWPDFPAYLDALAMQNPFALRDRLLQRVFAPAADPGRSLATAPPTDALRLRATIPAYVGQLAAQRAPVGALTRSPVDVADYVANVEQLHPSTCVDPALYAEIQVLLDDPPALHDLIVAHLDHLWETTLVAEWQRALRGPASLPQQIEVFQQHLTADATAAESFRTFTGRRLPHDLLVPADAIQQIILVPSAHNGWQLTTWYSDATLRIFFSAPANYTLLLRSSAIGSAELRTRLSALADDTRLRILALLAQQHELAAQEIIAQLELSQSSVSRHLKQLNAVGYVCERRGNGANKRYSLSTLNLDVTLRALEQLLVGDYRPADQPAADNSAHPQELKRLLDAQGRVVRWPSKLRERLLVLDYLAAQFEPGRSYSEREVNATLIAQIAFEDFVTLRRELYDYQLLNRERNGARYWRTASVAAATLHAD
jgi:biotin operon repressor